MNTNLNVRKPIVVSLLVLAFLVAAAVLLINALNSARMYVVTAESLPQIASRSLDDLQSGLEGSLLQPHPRVKFAALEGRKPPAAMEGKRLPPAALEGRKLPPAVMDGRRSPAGQSAPLGQLAGSFTLADGIVLLILVALLVAPTRKTDPLSS